MGSLIIAFAVSDVIFTIVIIVSVLKVATYIFRHILVGDTYIVKDGSMGPRDGHKASECRSPGARPRARRIFGLSQRGE